jgi:hypothetical protein
MAKLNRRMLKALPSGIKFAYPSTSHPIPERHVMSSARSDKIGFLLGTFCAGCIAMSLSPSAHGQNLVTNGGFETAARGVLFENWASTITGSGMDTLSQDMTDPNSGLADALFSLKPLSGSGKGTDEITLTQNLGSIVPGSPYQFSFYAQGNFPNVHDAQYTIQYQVGLNNDSTAFIPFEVNGSPDSQGYVLNSTTFTFPTGATTAGITFYLYNNDAAGATDLSLHLDDVSFSVPEPASLALITLAGLGMLRRRRRN